jgi:hypothetical protein
VLGPGPFFVVAACAYTIGLFVPMPLGPSAAFPVAFWLPIFVVPVLVFGSHASSDAIAETLSDTNGADAFWSLSVFQFTFLHWVAATLSIFLALFIQESLSKVDTYVSYTGFLLSHVCAVALSSILAIELAQAIRELYRRTRTRFIAYWMAISAIISGAGVTAEIAYWQSQKMYYLTWNVAVPRVSQTYLFPNALGSAMLWGTHPKQLDSGTTGHAVIEFAVAMMGLAFAAIAIHLIRLVCRRVVRRKNLTAAVGVKVH